MEHSKAIAPQDNRESCRWYINADVLLGTWSFSLGLLTILSMGSLTTFYRHIKGCPLEKFSLS